MSDIILVPGAFQGAWYWDPIVPALEAAGHRAFAVTLPGLEAEYSADHPVNLETHIKHVNGLVDDLDSDDVVLVGHSYGGMVITGAAATAPQKVSGLIYLDAPVPVTDQRVWDLIPEEGRIRSVAASLDGYTVQPAEQLKRIEPRSMPHPMATFLQPLDASTARLTMPRSFALAGKGSAFQSTFDRLSTDPAWECVSIPCGHDFVREAPDLVTDFILDRVAAARIV